MILTLEITGPQAEKLGATRRKVFSATGGAIGRLPDNYWALPDPYISSRHALIRYVNGVFYIEDTSTNGVFINSQDNRLVKGQPYALKSGDWIFIEPYEIRASITNPARDLAASPFEDLFASVPGPAVGAGDLFTPVPGREGAPSDSFQTDPFGSSRSSQSIQPTPPGPDSHSEIVDPLELLNLPPREIPRSERNASDLARGSLMNEHYRPPSAVKAESEALGEPGVIPSDYDPLASEDRLVLPPRQAPSARPANVERPIGHNAPAASAPAPVMRSSPQRGGAVRLPAESTFDAVADGSRGVVDLKTVLEGADIDVAAVTPELARSFGQILRVVVGGVMDVLQARQRIKSEFRIGMTTFKPADNNPLKFSANVDDALHNLLVKRNAAYLGPVEAFEDAFDDVRHHQVAMLAGLRVAFEAMLAEFDPDHLQADFDRQLKTGALVSVPAKLRYWELYRAKVHDMVRDSETCFRELFGDEFARAYEEQLKRLKAQGRTPKP